MRLSRDSQVQVGVRMSGSTLKLYRILALSVLLLVLPRVPLCMYAVYTASTVYDVVSPGSLLPGSGRSYVLGDGWSCT